MRAHARGHPNQSPEPACTCLRTCCRGDARRPRERQGFVVRDSAVVSLPLVGRDQGWGYDGHWICGGISPPDPFGATLPTRGREDHGELRGNNPSPDPLDRPSYLIIAGGSYISASVKIRLRSPFHSPWNLSSQRSAGDFDRRMVSSSGARCMVSSSPIAFRRLRRTRPAWAMPTACAAKS